MADILKLTDGTDTIDFVLASSDYALRKDGLDMPLPDIKRVMGGEPSLSEGQKLGDRRYANREITITFKIEGADHDTLVKDLRLVHRLLDRAKNQAIESFGSRVELHYKFTNATDEIVFDVLDGEFSPGQFASQTVKRNSLILSNELVLICKPFARLPNPIEVRNLLDNPGLDWNPGEGGRDGGRELQFESSAERLERTSLTGLFASGTPPIMSVGMWIKPVDATPAAVEYLMVAGHITLAWTFRRETDGKVTFEWAEVDNTLHTLTTQTAIPAGEWHWIGATIFTTDGTDTVTVLMLNDDTEDTERDAGPGAMRTPVGNFNVGALGAASPFDGEVSGAFIITGKQVLPYQLVYLFDHGIRSLYSSSEIMSDSYWGLEKTDFGAVWPFDEGSGDILDQSGNSRDLTVVGAVSRFVSQRVPQSWTIGANLAASTTSKLLSTDPKHGIFSFVFDAASSVSTKHLSQSITLPAGFTTSTIILWVKSKGGAGKKIEVAYDTDDNEITAGDQDVWEQWIHTSSIITGLFKVGWYGGSGSTDVEVDSIMLIPGTPFGTFSSGFTKVTGDPKPFIGGHEIIQFPQRASAGSVQNGRVNYLPIYDMPGDIPASTRVFVENNLSDIKAPIRLSGIQREPTKQRLVWGMDYMVPDFAQGSVYGTTVNPFIQADSDDAVFKSRVRISLSRLFPFPKEQYGNFRTYIGARGEINLVSLFRIRTLSATIPLTGDPQKDTNVASGRVHIMDAGNLAWPPEIALADYRANKVTSAPRSKLDDFTPELQIVNISDVVKTDIIEYEVIILMYIGDSYTLQPKDNKNEAGLQQNEILVIDTLDEESSNGYIITRNARPSGSGEIALLNSSDMSMFGSGFKIPPAKPYFIQVQSNKHGNSGDIPFGQFDFSAASNRLRLWIEYSPRFLYV